MHLGCGPVKWPGWVGVDLDEKADIKSDIRQLPFPSDHADAIAAIHVLEHFHSWEAGPMLIEWLRVLRPGGKLILELPCLDKVYQYIYICMKHGIKVPDFTGKFVFWGDPKHKCDLMVHKWGYHKSDIEMLLSACGYKNITITEPRYHFKERDMRVEASK